MFGYQRDENGHIVSKEVTAINDYTQDCLDVNDENKSRFMQAKAILCEDILIRDLHTPFPSC